MDVLFLAAAAAMALAVFALVEACDRPGARP